MTIQIARAEGFTPELQKFFQHVSEQFEIAVGPDQTEYYEKWMALIDAEVRRGASEIWLALENGEIVASTTIMTNTSDLLNRPSKIMAHLGVPEQGEKIAHAKAMQLENFVIDRKYQQESNMLKLKEIMRALKGKITERMAEHKPDILLAHTVNGRMAPILKRLLPKNAPEPHMIRYHNRSLPHQDKYYLPDEHLFIAASKESGIDLSFLKDVPHMWEPSAQPEPIIGKWTANSRTQNAHYRNLA